MQTNLSVQTMQTRAQLHGLHGEIGLHLIYSHLKKEGVSIICCWIIQPII